MCVCVCRQREEVYGGIDIAYAVGEDWENYYHSTLHKCGIIILWPLAKLLSPPGHCMCLRYLGVDNKRRCIHTRTWGKNEVYTPTRKSIYRLFSVNEVITTLPPTPIQSSTCSSHSDPTNIRIHIYTNKCIRCDSRNYDTFLVRYDCGKNVFLFSCSSLTCLPSDRSWFRKWNNALETISRFRS